MKLYENKMFKRVHKFALGVINSKRYKLMPMWLRVLSVIATAPIWCLFFVILACEYINLAVLKLVLLPGDFLSQQIKEDGDKLHPAVHVVMYLFAWPFLLGLRVLATLSFIDTILDFFFLSIFGYFASLGGVYFHPFSYGEATEVEVECTECNIVKDTVYVGVTLGALLIAIVCYGLGLISISIVSETLYIIAILGIYIFATVFVLFPYFYIPHAYSYRAKVEKVEEVK